MNRREFNKTLMLLTGVSAGATMSTIPLRALAAWPTDAFRADNIEGAVTAIFGTAEAEATDAIQMKGPDIAENGAVVPISVTSSVDGTENIVLLVAENPSPMVATFDGATAASTRIKMGKSSPLVAYVRAGGKLYTATSKEIKVTIGGCGG